MSDIPEPASPYTVETVPTAIGICHKIMPIKACIYVDNAHFDRWQGSTAAVEAYEVAQMFANAPKLAAEVARLRAALEDARISLLMQRNYMSNTRPADNAEEIEQHAHALAEAAVQQALDTATEALKEQP